MDVGSQTYIFERIPIEIPYFDTKNLLKKNLNPSFKNPNGVTGIWIPKN